MCELWVCSECFEFLLKGDAGLIRLNELNYAKYTHVALVTVISWRKLKRLQITSQTMLCYAQTMKQRLGLQVYTVNQNHNNPFLSQHSKL